MAIITEEYLFLGENGFTLNNGEVMWFLTAVE